MSLKCNQKLHIKGTLSRRLPRSKFRTIGRAAEKARNAGDVDIGDSSLTADAAELKRQVYVQLLTPANTVALPAFDRRTPRCCTAVLLRRPAAAVIDRDLLPDEPTSANLSSGVRWANGQTDDRRTDGRPTVA